MFETDMGIADELAKGDDIVEEFLEEASILVSDYDLKESYDHFLDYGEGMKKEGYQSGLEHGIEQGKQENSIETAKNMLGKEFSIDEIHEITKLPIEIIEELAGSASGEVKK